MKLRRESWTFAVVSAMLASATLCLWACPGPGPIIPPQCVGAACPHNPHPDMTSSTTLPPIYDPTPPEYVISMSQCPSGHGGAFCNVQIADNPPAPAPSPCEYPDKGYCSNTVAGQCLFQFYPDGYPCDNGDGVCKSHHCVRK